MKIVFVNDSVYEYSSGDPKNVGGAERQQWLLARALARAGWAVIVGVRKGLNAKERKIIDGVQFIGIGGGHFLWTCYRFLLSERPDWWYWRAANHWWGPAVLVAKLSGVRTIFAAAFDSDVNPRFALFRRPSLWPLYAWGLAQSDRIFVQHSGQFSQLATRWQAKAHVVPSLAGEMPIGTHKAEPKGYVAWVGTLRQPKRADLLIEIARRLPDTKFMVCGGPTTYQTSPGYCQQIMDGLHALRNVEFLGRVGTKEAQKIIAEATLFLSTADEEGFPNTFLEAWASGTPVVSLTIDPDGIIQQKGLGMVSKSVEGAVADIKTLMEFPQRRTDIGLRAQQHVAGRHSEPVVTQIFERAVLSAMAN